MQIRISKSGKIQNHTEKTKYNNAQVLVVIKRMQGQCTLIKRTPTPEEKNEITNIH